MGSEKTAPVVIVTGASGGIGRACVAAFRSSLARVMMADIDESGQILIETDSTDELCFHRTDLADARSVKQLIEMTIRCFGRLDVLVNNAAVIPPMLPVHETSEEILDHFFSINLRGAFLACKYAYPHLKQSRGSVVNVSSMAGVCGEASHAAYCAMKGGLNALTKAMAIDYGGIGIRCNAVCPSSVLTPATDRMIEQCSDPQAVIEFRRRLNHLGYTAGPEEIARVIVFLASPEASFMTGAIIPVSGGSECGYGFKERVA